MRSRRESDMKHTLKTLPHFFQAIVRGEKTCEVRLDRGFQIGDELELLEYDGKKLTGEGLLLKITFIQRLSVCGVAEYAIISFKQLGSWITIKDKKNRTRWKFSSPKNTPTKRRTA